MREIAAPWGLLTRYIARGPENPTGMSNFFSGLPAGPRTEGVGAAGADYNQPPRRSPDRPMSSADQVTLWIAQLKDGEHVAVQRLLEVYFRRLVGLARTAPGRPRTGRVGRGRGTERLQKPLPGGRAGSIRSAG